MSFRVIGTGSGYVAAGDDSRIVNAIQNTQVTNSIAYTAGELQLVGDVGIPSPGTYYGFVGGVKGWFSTPTGSATGDMSKSQYDTLNNGTVNSARVALVASSSISSSFASSSISASYAANADFATSASFAQQAINANNATFANNAFGATSASVATFASTASLALFANAPTVGTSIVNKAYVDSITSSFATFGNYVVTASAANDNTTASYALNAATASVAKVAVSVPYSGITSLPQLISQSQDVTLGNISSSGDVWIAGKITALEYDIQHVSSSVIYSSGSTKFGEDLTNVHQFTGSVTITGSLTVSGVSNVTASSAVTASFSLTTLPVYVVTSSAANDNTTASYALKSDFAVASVSSSYASTASLAVSSSFASSSYFSFSSVSSSNATVAASSSLSSELRPAIRVVSASYSALGSDATIVLSGSANVIITLPPVATTPVGKTYDIKSILNINATASVTSSAGDLIFEESEATNFGIARLESITVQNAGAFWIAI